MGIISIYNHLNKRLVEEGDLKRGQMIGLMGIQVLQRASIYIGG